VTALHGTASVVCECPINRFTDPNPRLKSLLHVTLSNDRLLRRVIDMITQQIITSSVCELVLSAPAQHLAAFRVRAFVLAC
jgi:hypothetical protein